nr:hypothetical protein [uncultured Desulfobacter sp.]
MAIDFQQFSKIHEELRDGLGLFWKKAACILEDSGVQLVIPKRDDIRMEDHFFSLLFLYAYLKAGIDPQRRILYVAVNQCLRGMVTGCDNLLDQEYKVTLETGLPKEATIFRSVLDIMVSDRVLTQIMFHGFDRGLFTMDQVKSSGKISLDALIQSGAQEAGEEKGVYEILPAKSVLNDIHSIKTGLLFQAPWALPERFENKLDIDKCENIKTALFNIGLGCQILDDLVDLITDLKMKRHNYVVSLFHESEKEACREFIDTIGKHEDAVNKKDLISALQKTHPDLFKLAADQAETYIQSGCRELFSGEQEAMIPFCVSFLIDRIGAQAYFESHRVETDLT